jgi:putative hydrolase of the HAD superfamily
MTKRGLILDFGGVLTSNVSEATFGFDRREGLPEGSFMTLVGKEAEGRELFAQLERGLISQAEWGERTGALLGVDGTDLLPRVLADLRTVPAVAAAAQRARAAGIRVALLSNSVGLAPYDPYLGLNLPDLFDVVVLSDHHKIAKPDPALYELTLERLGLTGVECVFVDDTPGHLRPAEALGISTVLATSTDDTIHQVERLLGLSLSA